jgi:HD-GYP domain-containing protein (c-di-GMP phosphodiesterase class II)
MSNETENQYRPIDLEFLTTGGEDFDIFTKTKEFGTTKFVRFASSAPEHQERIRRMIESGDHEINFYIKEEDLFKYYRLATHSLRNFVSDASVPVKKKAEKVYEVSKGVMKEFFSYNASGKILESSGEVMGMMEECMSTTNFGFKGIATLTSKDYYTHTHSVNVGLYCMTLGVKIKMPREEIKALGLGGMLHDVGKSQIDSELINKNGKLSDEEFEAMKSHAPIGQKILTEMQCYGSKVICMAGQHHEKFAGGGYPLGLRGDEISVYARICKIMDVYDALTTRRSYKLAMRPFDTLALMTKQMAGDFDPKLMHLFIKHMGPEL